MSSPIAVPELLRAALEAAQTEIVRLAPRYLPEGGPYTTQLLSVGKRTHSLIGRIELRGPGGVRRFFLKVVRTNPRNAEIKRAQLEREYALLDDLTLRFEPHVELTVIRPVCRWPELAAMLSEEFPGVTLEHYLARARQMPTPGALAAAGEACRRVGRWLSLFQGFTKSNELGAFDPTELIGYCERRLRIFSDASARGFASGISSDLLTRVERLARAVEPDECLMVGRQNDFRPDNMLTDGRRIAVLDFTGFTYGPALYDFMKFQMKLEDLRRGLMLRPRAVAAWTDAFHEGYGTPVDLGSPLAILLRICNVLDKMSELTLGQAATHSLRARRRLVAHYRARLRDLEHVLEEADAR